MLLPPNFMEYEVMKQPAHAPFLAESRIWTIIERESRPDDARIQELLDKAAAGKGLALDESAALPPPMSEDNPQKL